MAEELEVYDLDGNLLNVQERGAFYSEIKKEFAETGKITRQVKAVRLLLMNTEGRIYLQKRSKTKNENPGLYDKTVGGHVPKGHTWQMTVIRECAEELGFPAAILPEEEFEEAVRTTDLNIVGVVRKIDHIKRFESVRVTQKGDRFVQPYITTMYIGYYNGSIRFIDGESSGIEVFSLEELKQEIKNNPNKFTEDIKFMIEKYEQFLKPIK